MRTRPLFLSLVISPIFFTATVFAEETLRSPLGNAVGVDVRNLSAEEAKELGELEEVVQSYEQRVEERQADSQKVLKTRYAEKRQILNDSYEKRIQEVEEKQRIERLAAIEKFEAFVKRYPRDDRYTPDAMFRLGELYFEQSYENYFQSRQAFDKAMEGFSAGPGKSEPVEPVFHYEPTIAMLQRLITEFPKYRLTDGAYYLLGYCLGEQGEEGRAVDSYQELVRKFPESKFAAEVWTRIGEYYFSENELDRALAAYSKVLGHADSPFYDKAMYKLAWTHYRLADPERAPEEFQKAVDTFVELLEFNEKTKASGNERGQDLRDESIQYIAISYADEQWGSLDKLLAYLAAKPNRPYERDLLIALGDVYFDQTRFVDATRAYRVVQERFSDSPDAPRVQEKLIIAFERERNFDEAAVARDELTSRFSKGGAWYEKNRDNPEALKAADDLTTKSLYSAALFHHRQAQIHKEAKKIDLATQEYRKAAEAYGVYLNRFPHDRQLYELTYYYAECLYYSLNFLDAAKRYENVRDSNADNRFLEEAAFSSVLSYENAVKQLESRGELAVAKVRPSTDRANEPIQAKEIPAIKLQIIEASDRYAAVAPNSEKVPKILYKASEIYYAYDHFEEARKRFESLLLAHPQHETAEYAANLIIESYLAEKNFAEVEKFTRLLLERPATPGRREFKGELVKFKSGAMFKIAEDLDARGEHEQAAVEYLKLIEENPDNQFADVALNNAAVALEKVKRFDSASKLYERLARQYPKSAMADNAIFRVGLNAERFFDFDRAIAAYLKLVEQYPKSEKRPDAIYNAAYSLENTQSYEKAAEQYGRYCKLYPSRPDAPDVCFRAGVVFEKMEKPKLVISTYQAFVQRYRSRSEHSDRLVEAHLKMAQAYQKLGKEKEADRSYLAAVAEFRRTGQQTKSAPYAAQAQFETVEQKFDAFKRIKFVGTSKAQIAALKTKAAALKSVEDGYKDILKFKQIDWTLAALFRIGQLYQSFAESLVNAECPPDVKKTAKRAGFTVAEVCDEYRISLEEKATNAEDKAVAAYETTIGKARELQVANVWTKQTLLALNKLRRKQWPLQKDALYYVDEQIVAVPSLIDNEGKTLTARDKQEDGPTSAPPAPGPATSTEQQNTENK